MTGIDLNRAGMPLLEIVSEPDLRNAKEAAAYFRQMHTLVRYIGICDGNLNEGSMRCDANVSVRPCGATELGERTEIKNLNSFRFLERAIDHEVARQIEVDRERRARAARNAAVRPRSRRDAHDAQQRAVGRLSLLPRTRSAAGRHRSKRSLRRCATHCRNCRSRSATAT